MTKYICEIGASSWFYYKDICYDARTHERKITVLNLVSTPFIPAVSHSLLFQLNAHNMLNTYLY